MTNSLFAANQHDSIRCSYLSGRDKVVFTDGKAVGVRRDLNGILLLDTALQTPIAKTDDTVRVELSLPEVSHILTFQQQFCNLFINLLDGPEGLVIAEFDNVWCKY